MTAHDVAIYAPAAACLYERSPQVTGGAERQTMLLAGGLARMGLRVAHIVLPVSDPVVPEEGSLTLVERELVTTDRGPRARAHQLRQVWSALAAADAAVYIFRSGIPALGVAAMYRRARNRRLVFSSSNNLDFTFEFYEGRRPERELYRFGIRNSDAVVVQSQEQAQLARQAAQRLPRLVEIPSFAEPAAPSPMKPEAFLWVGRLDVYKQPLRYLELAEALPEARFWMVARETDPHRSGGSPGRAEDPELEREVLERAAALPNLEILPQRPHAEAMELVDRSVAIVNTGAAEGMPNLFLEAWGRGVPVLSYEFDPDGRLASRGLGLAAGGSAREFAEGARRLWSERFDRAELSSRVRSYIQSVHGIDAVTRRWAGTIDELRTR